MAVVEILEVDSVDPTVTEEREVEREVVDVDLTTEEGNVSQIPKPAWQPWPQ